MRRSSSRRRDRERASARTEQRVKFAILAVLAVAGACLVKSDELFFGGSARRWEEEYAPVLEDHEDTWIVAVGASRYFSNYRHGSNALAIRRVARTVPSERTLLMLAEVAACDARNMRRGEVSLEATGKNNNYYSTGRSGASSDEETCDGGASFEGVAYSGLEVTPDRVLDVLAGRYAVTEALSRRLRSTRRSNVLVYLTGHGGDEFLKFHDSDELSARALAAAIEEMAAKGRYRKLTLVVDTCQAASLFSHLTPRRHPHVLAIASAETGQNAYAALADRDLGVPLTDRFTQHAVAWLAAHSDARGVPRGTFGAFVDAMRLSGPSIRSTLHVLHTARTFARPDAWRDTALAEFFADPPQNLTRLRPWKATTVTTTATSSS